MSKKQRKEQCQLAWGLLVNGHIPMVLVSTVDQHIQTILNQIIDGIASIGIQLILVQPREEETLKQCLDWQQKHPESIKVVTPQEADETIYDMEILEDVTVDKLKELRDRQLVPVAESGKVEPFDPIEERGNGFLFQKGNPWSLLVELVRAKETYRFPYDWRNVVRGSRQDLIP
ncbi:MAG: hypothetical protein U1C97_01025 [Candidatus Gracilibacteria bacterium]|nr:hypothetical protein [bacterium]MDZ4216884.1 hypothetical protein [Candidatus Gracilibacteria bacterium]